MRQCLLIARYLLKRVLKNIIIILLSHLNQASPEPVEGSAKPKKPRILGDLGVFQHPDR